MIATPNKKNLVRVAIFLLIGVFVVPAIASAFRHGPGKSERGVGMHGKNMQWISFHIWNNPKMVQDLGLSDEQIGKLKDADFAMKENHLELKSQLNRLNLEMEKIFSEKVINDSEVLESAKKISEIRSKMFLDRIESRLQMTKILTEDQLEKLEALRPGPCEDRKKFGKYDNRVNRNWKKDMM